MNWVNRSSVSRSSIKLCEGSVTETMDSNVLWTDRLKILRHEKAIQRASRERDSVRSSTVQHTATQEGNKSNSRAATVTVITEVNVKTVGACHHCCGAQIQPASRAARGFAATATSPAERVPVRDQWEQHDRGGRQSREHDPNTTATLRFRGSGASAQSRIAPVGVDELIAASNGPSGIVLWACGSNVMVGSSPASHAGSAWASS